MATNGRQTDTQDGGEVNLRAMSHEELVAYAEGLQDQISLLNLSNRTLANPDNWFDDAAEAATALSPALAAVAEERARQVARGFTAESDDQYATGELAVVGSIYAFMAKDEMQHEIARDMAGKGLTPNWWPWDKAWFRPEATSLDTLVKSGALIVAEIDRRLRKATGG